MQDAVVLHALRVLREWVHTLDQVRLQAVNIRAGGDLVRHRLKDWLATGRCTLQYLAASELVEDLRGMPECSHTKVPLTPIPAAGGFGWRRRNG